MVNFYQSPPERSSDRLCVSQLAKQVDENHFVDGTSSRAGDARVSDDDGQALCARNGDVDPIAVQDEGKPARAVFPIAGTKGKNADGGL